MTPSDILTFWFGAYLDDGEVCREKFPVWWEKSAQVDREIAERFLPALKLAAAGQLDEWKQSPRGVLALIVLLDQFSRNIYRGLPEAFAQDELALSLSFEALAAGEDTALRPVERAFLYMPLEHSESLSHQDACVRLFSELAEQVPPAWREHFRTFREFAIRHRKIIQRFGRFPHRNAILGRKSTDEETAFLGEPDSSF